MKAMEYKILRQYKRGHQYEILYDVYEDSGKLIVGNLIHTVGPELLGDKELAVLFDMVIFPMIQVMGEEKEKEIYTKDEIETLLREKGYLTETQVLEDLPVKI